jgi:hypothetical protein
MRFKNVSHSYSAVVLMEMQEMIERLLAGQAKADADREQMLARMSVNMKTMQEKADADRKADREELKGLMDANTKSIVRAFHEKMGACVASRRDDREVTMSCHEKIEPNSGEKEAAVGRQKIPNVEVAIHSLRASRSETAVSQEATETEPDPGTMQSVEEHQKIPMEEAAVMSAGGLKKRRRARNLAAGCRQRPNGRIQASNESRRS